MAAKTSKPGLMLCELVDRPFDDPEWLFEPKLDGLRVLCEFDGEQWSLTSRNGKSQDFQFPDVIAALGRPRSKGILVDGEIVCLDEKGRPSFQALQQRFHILDAEVVRERARRYPAYLYVFDIMSKAGRDLRPKPLKERKQILKDALLWSDFIRFVKGVAGRGRRMLADECARMGEGIVAKRLDSPYVAERSGAWLKIKCSGRQEFVIGGFTEPQRSRVGLGALLVGYYARGKLRYAGKVGTGYTREVLLDLRGRLEGMVRKGCPFVGDECLREAGVHWVRPTLVAEIAFAEWTQNGLLRQPRFEGLREDKDARVVKRETAKMVGKK